QPPPPQERVPKKNKLVPILVGVTKNSVVRLDVETKDILKEWPLVQLRRWAASPNSFTLDFGDYADAYYSVQTSEGEQISQLIAGYIDIIMKKKKESEKIVPEEEEEHATVEEYVRPGRATNIGLVSNGYRTATETVVAPKPMVADGMRPGYGQVQQPSFPVQLSPNGFAHTPEYSSLQQALLLNIRNGFAMVNNAAADLGMAIQLPPLGNDAASLQWRQQTLDVNAENVAAQIASHLAAAGSLVNHATGVVENMNYDTLGANVASLSSNLNQLNQGLKLLSALADNDNEKEKLMEAAARLAMATSKLLDMAQPVIMGQGNRKKELHESAKELALTASQLLNQLQKLDVPEDSQHNLYDLANAIAKAVKDLVNNARTAASQIADKEVQHRISQDAKTAYESASQLVATTSAVSPAITSQLCKDQLMEASVVLKDNVNLLLGTCNPCPNQKTMQALAEAAQKVEESIAKLVERARKVAEGGTGKVQETEMDQQYDMVLSSIDSMVHAYGNTEAIVTSAKELTLTSTQFINGLKAASAQIGDPNEKLQLEMAARRLADSVAKMFASAKDAARNARDTGRQAQLAAAVEDLRKAANSAAGPQARDRALGKLAKAVKDSITSSNQLIMAAKSVAASNRNQQSQLALNQAARKVNETTPMLVTAMKGYLGKTDDLTNQIKLINAAKQFIVPVEAMVSAAKVAAPTTGDAGQTQLLTAAKQVNDDLRAVEKAFRLADELSQQLQLESALISVKGIQKELQSVQEGQPAPSSSTAQPMSAEHAQQELASMASSITNAIGQLAAAASQKNEKFMGIAATDAVMALQALSVAAQGYAAMVGEEEVDLKSQMLNAANGVASTMSSLLSKAKQVALVDGAGDVGGDGEVVDPATAAMNAAAAATDLESLIQSANRALGGIIDALPGQRDLERAVGSIGQIVESMAAYRGGVRPDSSYQNAQKRVQGAASEMAMATNNIVSASNGAFTDLKPAADGFEQAFRNLTDATLIFGATTSDVAMMGKLVDFLQDLGASSTSLLQFTKSSSADRQNTDLRNRLLNAARHVGEAMNFLLDMCSVSAPGLAECARATQTLSIASSKLDTGTNEVGANQDNYAECVGKMAESSKALFSCVGAVPTLARGTDLGRVAGKVLDAANIVAGIADVSTRAAYLIGISDPSSVAATPGSVDRTAFVQAGNQIKEACRDMLDPKNTAKEVLEKTALIAKDTSTLMNVCKAAGANPAVSPSARLQFVASSKELAAKTSTLANSIKRLATDLTNDESREQYVVASTQLIEAVDNLIAFAMSPEFAGTKAKISPQGNMAQKPLVDSTKNVIAAVETVVNTAKVLCAGGAGSGTASASSPTSPTAVTPERDEQALQALTTQVRGVTDAVTKLVQTISSRAPGQKECDDALAKVMESIAAIDAAIVEAAVNNLAPQSGLDKATLVENMRALASLVDMIAKAAKTDPGQLGATVSELPFNFAQSATATIAVASNSPDLGAQKAILNDAKEAGESLVQFLYTAKNVGGNGKFLEGHKQLDLGKTKVRNTLGKLVTTLEGAAMDSGEFAKAADKIEALLTNLDSRPPVPLNQPYQVWANEIDTVGKQVVEVVGDVIAKAKTPEQYRTLAGRVGELYETMVSVGVTASSLAEDAKVKASLHDALRELGASGIKFIEAMRNASGKSSADQASRTRLGQAAREISMSVANIMNVAKEGSKGLLICQQAVANINDLVTDLESAIIFAQAGQLDPLDHKESFTRHKDQLLSAAKSLTEQVKGFITGITGTQEELSNLAIGSVNALQSLKDQVRRGATAISSGDKHMQNQLLSAGKAVAESLQVLISTAMNVLGKPANDPSMTEFTDAVKTEFSAIAEIIRVTKLLGDETTRGLRALDGAMADLDDIVVILESDAPAQGTALPDEVAALAKQLATAAASLVSTTAGSSSGGKQDELVAAAAAVKKQADDLARAGKAATEKAPPAKKQEMVQAVVKAISATKNLLARMKLVQENNTPTSKAGVQSAAKDVATAVSEIVGVTTSLIPGGYVDPNDPNVIAERELLAAAASIEAAAKKLAGLVPEGQAMRPKAPNEELNFEGQIVDAAKAIAAATAALVRSATTVQRDIISQGRIGPKAEQMYFSDGTWSDGLVSAAKLVAQATQDLCDAANQAMKGNVRRERVIVSAKGVSSATAQLLTAAMVRADPNSQSQIRLKAAGKAVTNATDQLVKAAEESMAFEDEMGGAATAPAAAGGEGSNKTSARVMEMEAQMSILKMEKELEKARAKLAAVRKGRYEGKTQPAK
ncbi:Talin-1, partial [Quaeritorhiza haematococci]